MNKTVPIIILLFLAIPLHSEVTVSSGGSGDASIAFGGSGTVSIKAGTVTGGGGSPFQVGNDTVYGTETLNNNDEVYSDATGVSVGTTGTYDTCFYWSYCTIGGNAKILIYDDSSPQNLICTSDVIAISDSGGWISDDMSDNSCGTYTANDVIHIALVTDCFHYLKSNGSGDWDYGQNTDGSYASPPATVTNFTAGDGDIEPSEPHSAYCTMVGE